MRGLPDNNADGVEGTIPYKYMELEFFSIRISKADEKLDEKLTEEPLSVGYVLYRIIIQVQSKFSIKYTYILL